MSDYDNYYLGVGNSQHPANLNDDYFEFDSLDIRECYEYGDEEKTLLAISHNEKKLANAKSELQFLIEYLHQSENVFVKNKLIKLKKQL